MRVLVQKEPFSDRTRNWTSRGDWPAMWITHPAARADEPAVIAFKCAFSLSKQTILRIHVSADERYELFLNGDRIGRGPERGDERNWFFESYDMELPAGSSILVARTWRLGPGGPSPIAQHSVQPGFLLAAEGAKASLLNTGVAAWQCARMDGYTWIPPDFAWGTGAKIRVCGGRFAWGFENGSGDWGPVHVLEKAANASMVNNYPCIWNLRPALLPPMIEETIRVGRTRHLQSVASGDTEAIPVDSSDHRVEEAERWDALLAGEACLSIPPHTMRRVIIDLDQYYCAYPEVTTSGGAGALIRIRWAESLYQTPEPGAKGNRDEMEGKYFIGVGDIFEPDGGKNRRFETLWWECGRYMEVFLRTGASPLTMERFCLRETHYPLKHESFFQTPDPRFASAAKTMIRTLEMCAHETYMDCPYYEQLQYVGDTRLEALTTYVLTRDDRLPRKAILAFDWSRMNSGLTQSRYPSRVTLIIPPFSLWWISMVHDYALWRDDRGFVRDRMPGVRMVLDVFRRWVNADHLVEAPNGWNFVDWVPGWDNGIPPGADHGVSGIINWQLVLVLGMAAELEDLFGEAELASRNRTLASRVAASAASAFWDEDRGLFADDLEKQSYSEHAQCLALLGGTVEPLKRIRISDGLREPGDLARATIYFQHYLFEAYRDLGCMHLFADRMGSWFDLGKQGFKTTVEQPEPSRSDCHGWGAHPYYHFFASVLGIRPHSPGFSTVRIEPQLGSLSWVRGSLPHPRGTISLEWVFEDQRISGWIELPDGVSGEWVYNGAPRRLKPGHQVL